MGDLGGNHFSGVFKARSSLWWVKDLIQRRDVRKVEILEAEEGASNWRIVHN